MVIGVVIPVYRPLPTADEGLSLRRTLMVLDKYPLILVCPETLDISRYEEIAMDYRQVLQAERFNDNYFLGIAGYNRLLLSECFYRRFQDFDYILICQLDAYVFRDELKEWCQKNYDYIGAPLIGHYQDQSFSKKMRVGNGGFSLRSVQTILRYFDSRKNVFSPSQTAERISLWKKPYTRIFVWLLMMLGWRNKPVSVAANWKYNEDDFWSGLLNGTRYQLRTPEIAEAIRFSFERFPSELYEMNHHQLPFGCHAWRKYQYESFWSKYID